jgi:hypothetical protein
VRKHWLPKPSERVRQSLKPSAASSIYHTVLEKYNFLYVMYLEKS